ncbi:hypothetical protein F2Q69_00036258 [Brassica cretica]|uniref:Uncharacterized protein n=1 Tax=Brassica cretica TaxID=69181 RepID=A0A8S9SRT0_BRACR|nr:hypothetical protein F2Q69_00036258 [Brassica cretica]
MDKPVNQMYLRDACRSSVPGTKLGVPSSGDLERSLIGDLRVEFSFKDLELQGQLGICIFLSSMKSGYLTLQGLDLSRLELVKLFHIRIYGRLSLSEVFHFLEEGRDPGTGPGKLHNREPGFLLAGILGTAVPSSGDPENRGFFQRGSRGRYRAWWPASEWQNVKSKQVPAVALPREEEYGSCEKQNIPGSQGTSGPYVSPRSKEETQGSPIRLRVLCIKPEEEPPGSPIASGLQSKISGSKEEPSGSNYDVRICQRISGLLYRLRAPVVIRGSRKDLRVSSTISGSKENIRAPPRPPCPHTSSGLRDQPPDSKSPYFSSKPPGSEPPPLQVPQ